MEMGLTYGLENEQVCDPFFHQRRCKITVLWVKLM